MRPKFKELVWWIFPAVFILLVFRNWFNFSEISAGDAPFYFEPTLKDFSFIPYLWFTRGLGLFNPLLNGFPAFVFPITLLSSLNIPWALIERLVWYWPFLFISIFSSWFLIKTVTTETKFRFLSPLIYASNSYILMIVGGGQISIALSYAILPLTLAVFIKNITKTTQVLSLTSGLILALQIIFEPRIAALAILAAAIYAFLKYQFAIRRYIATLFIPLVSTVGVHFYWILPAILLRKEAYSPSLSYFGWVEFLSFAQFSNTLSLLHHLWPENIFGKISFMRWEFLMIPIIAYASLLFIGRTRRATNKERITTNNILFFAVLGLLGAFLAKGANPPLGEIYLWLFENFPGMNMFRDPTKFYTLVALSYSVLIPYSVSSIHSWLSSKCKVQSAKLQLKVQNYFKNYLPSLFLLLTIFYLLFLIRPAWMGELGGTFKSREVPQEYVELKNFLSSQPEFFRTFWVPKKQRFGFYSNNHPLLSAEEFVSPDVCQPPLCVIADESEKPPKLDPLTVPEGEILDKVRNYSLSYFDNPNALETFAWMGVKYVIVPSDPEGEIFLRDRKYNEEERGKYIAFLDSIPWLQKIGECCFNDSNHDNKIIIYQIPFHQDHFFIEGNQSTKVVWRMINPTKYELEIKNATQPFTLIFAETYDGLWQAKINGEIIPSKKIYETLNSFYINKKGDFEITVEFAAQKYVWYGLVVSLVTLSTSLFFLLLKR